MAMPCRTPLVIAVIVTWAIVGPSAQVVSLHKASALKQDFPFVRFETLAGFALPIVAAHGFAASPHREPGPRQAQPAIPSEVRALHGTPISVRGYMLPLDLDARGVSSFLLTASIDSCHFGTLGAVNEWIAVTMNAGARVQYDQGRPVTVFGRLIVEPDIQNGTIVGLYRMAAQFLAVH
jgi:hypothetical protein